MLSQLSNYRSKREWTEKLISDQTSIHIRNIKNKMTQSSTYYAPGTAKLSILKEHRCVQRAITYY